jgi:hypothetical protein
MRRLVTVGLVDLKKLVGMCIDLQVEDRAQVMALNEPGRSTPTAALDFAGLVDKARPKARKQVRLHFRRLLKAVESGDDVDASLKSFVHGLNPESLQVI